MGRVSALSALLTALVAVAVFRPAAALAADSCSTCLNAGLREYEQMNYPEAARWFGLAAAQEAGCAKDERTLLHVSLAKLCLIHEDHTGAVREMKKALQIDPFLTVNPVDASPKVIAALNKAREELKATAQAQPGGAPPPPPPRPSPNPGQRVAAWSLFGAGSALTLGAGATLGLAYAEDAKQREAAKDNDRSARDQHWRNTTGLATGSGFLGSAAAVCFATAFYLLWTSDGGQASLVEPPASDYAAVTPAIGPDGFGLIVGIRF